MENRDLYKNSTSPRLEFPHLKPYDCVSDYIQSKTFHEMDKIYPEFDVVRMDDPKSYLAMLGIKLQFTEKMLAQKRKSLSEMRQDLDQQWEDLDAKESSLRESFRNFDVFIKENMEKRERAEKKIKEDKKLLEQRKKDIEQCNLDYLDIKSAKFEMDQKIKEYRLYENYLNKVVDTSDEFVSSQDMINRYMSLLSAKNYLAKLQENNLRALESAKSDMTKLIEEKSFILMGLNNQIAALQARFENAKIKSLECEQLVLQIKNNAVIQMNEIEEVKCSIWNVYCHMVASKKHPIKIKKENVEEQMLYVKRTLTEISKVNQILRKRAKQGAAASKKERERSK